MIGKSSFSQEVADDICRRISEGEPLKPICREEGMPCWRTVYNWIDSIPEFAASMEVARKLGARAIAEECLAIADDASNDFMLRNDIEVINTEHIQRSKLRIETRLKLLAKWHPKEYGDKVDLNHGLQPNDPIAALFASCSGTRLKPNEPRKPD